MTAQEREWLVSVDGISKTFARQGRRGAEVRALDDVSFRLARGDVLGVVGESGSGKTTLSRCLAGLVDTSSGTVDVCGTTWTGRLGSPARRKLARKLQLVFQDPFGSLNPRMRVGALVGEGLLVHHLAARGAELDARVEKLLEQVGLRGSFALRHPRELSGGQRQRVAIARALAVEPEVLILDEPVSSLDLSVQAQVLNLIRDLIAERDRSVLFVSHDLAVVRFVCDSVIVMQDGTIVERGPVEDVLSDPQHAFTRELIASAPGRRGRS